MKALRLGMTIVVVALEVALTPALAAPLRAPAAPTGNPAIIQVQSAVRCRLGNGQVVMLPPADCTARGGRIVR